VRLFSDFRYAEAARAVEGVEFVETKRSLVAALAELLEGRSASRPTRSATPLGGLRRAGSSSSARGPRRGAARGQGRRASSSDPARGAITSEAYARFAEERFVGRTERELAWRLDELFHELGGHAPAFETIVASGRTARAARAADRPHVEPARRSSSTRARWSTATTPTARAPSPPGRCRTSSERVRGCPARRSLRVDADAAGVSAPTPTRRPDRDRGRGFGEKFGHGLGHGVGLSARATALRAIERRSSPATSSTVEPGIYLEDAAACRIEDLVVSRGEPDDASES
jgi:hypothetical protein